MKFKCSVTLETHKAWGTIPFIGIYLRLRLQVWLKVGSFVSFPKFQNLFCQEDNDANFVTNSVTHLLVV